MFVVEDLRFAYPHRPCVLDGVSLSLDRGDILCLLGPNGTGKTTLLNCLMGLYRPRAGRIEVDGEDVTRMSATRRASLLAYVPQSSSLAFAYDVLEVVLMGRVAHLPLGAAHSRADVDVARSCLERLGIAHLEERTFQELSGGERQMVLVARALAQQANYLVMDEPTASLDYGNQVHVLQTIQSLAQEGFGILMTSHFPDHAFLGATKVALLKGGRVLAQGAPQDVVTSQSLSDLYGTAVCVSKADVFGTPTSVCVPVLGPSARPVADTAPTAGLR